METHTQSHDFGNSLVIGASFERQKAKRIPWRKDFIDHPGILLTVSGTGEIFFKDAHQQLVVGDLVLYDPLPQHLSQRPGFDVPGHGLFPDLRQQGDEQGLEGQSDALLRSVR